MDSRELIAAADTIRAGSAGSSGNEDQEKVSKHGRTINFAEKLHLVLSNKECQDAIAWLPSGRSFCIISKDKFVNTILPKFFKSRANFNSFERRLKTWGFSKMDASSRVYAFSHVSFNRNTHTEDELEEEGNSFNVMRQLRTLLSDPKFSTFIWWVPSGDSFCVASTSESASKVLFQYFGETQFKSFVATLKREGFKRVNTTDFFGEAVYSHESFRIGRPDLCSRMCRGGNPELNGEGEAHMGASCNNTTDTFLSATAQGNIPYSAAGVNPALMAQRSSVNMNFPIPMNNGMSTQYHAGIAQASHPLMNTTYSHEMLRSVNPYTFNGMGHPQTMMRPFSQLSQPMNQESLLFKQSPILHGHARSSSVIQQQLAAQGNPQQQMVSNILPRRNPAPIAQLEQQVGQQGGSASGTDSAQMTILEIEDELLRVKELKLMTMKRKLEAQLETNEKE